MDFRFLQLLRVGPGARLPMLPALYPAKKRWPLTEQGDPRNYLEQVNTVSMWRTNCASLDAFSDKVFAGVGRPNYTWPSHQDDGTRGPSTLSRPCGRFARCRGAVSARVLFDGTHGITVNTRTRIRDQERGPIAADLKRIMREKSRVGVSTFALTADVSEAHRQIPVAEQDWHLLGCRVVPGGSVFINTVGTFGVASTSHYWSRDASAVGRLAQYLAGNTAYTWHMLVADDYHLDAGGANYRTAGARQQGVM